MSNWKCQIYKSFNFDLDEVFSINLPNHSIFSLTFKTDWSSYVRGVFRFMSNYYDGAFSENKSRNKSRLEALFLKKKKQKKNILNSTFR